MVFWLTVIAVRAAAGQLMQHFICFFSFRHSRGAQRYVSHHRRPMSSHAFQSYLHIFTFLYSECLFEKTENKNYLFICIVYSHWSPPVAVVFLFDVQADAMAWANSNVTIEVYRSNLRTIGQKNRLKYLSIHQVEMRRTMGLAAGSLSRWRVWIRPVARLSKLLKHFYFITIWWRMLSVWKSGRAVANLRHVLTKNMKNDGK